MPDDVETDEPRSTGFRLDITNIASVKQKAIMVRETQYGGVILDDPDGFTLPDELLDVFRRPLETFLFS